MRRVSTLLLGLCLFGLAAPPIQAAEKESYEPAKRRRSSLLHNRVSAGLIFEASPPAGEHSLELVLGERLRWSLLRSDKLDLDLNIDGRLGIRLLDGGRIDRLRVRELGVRLRGPKWSLVLGRHVIDGGGGRMVDGAQLLAYPAPRVEVGGWAGLVPDPYTSAPALRFGGGPILALTKRIFQLRFVGEILGVPGGLERAGGIFTARVEAQKHFEFLTRIDLQYGGPDHPVLPADLAVFLRASPHQTLRLNAFYDLYSSHSFLRTAKQDPGIQRFEARASGLLEDDGTIPGDKLDTTLHHLVGLSARWRPIIGKQNIARLDLGLRARYRHHELGARRYVLASLQEGVVGLLGGRLDLGLSQSVSWWAGALRIEPGANAYLELGKQGAVALDASVRVGFERPAGEDKFRPSVYADLFVDWRIRPSLLLSIGYSFGNDLDEVAWNPVHTAMLRASWNLRARRADNASIEVTP